VGGWGAERYKPGIEQVIAYFAIRFRSSGALHSMALLQRIPGFAGRLDCIAYFLAEHASGFQNPTSGWLLAIIDLQVNSSSPCLGAESTKIELIHPCLG